jgi:hypothetical protein
MLLAISLTKLLILNTDLLSNQTSCLESSISSGLYSRLAVNLAHSTTILNALPGSILAHVDNENSLELELTELHSHHSEYNPYNILLTKEGNLTTSFCKTNKSSPTKCSNAQTMNFNDRKQNQNPNHIKP